MTPDAASVKKWEANNNSEHSQPLRLCATIFHHMIFILIFFYWSRSARSLSCINTHAKKSGAFTVTMPENSTPHNDKSFDIWGWRILRNFMNIKMFWSHQRSQREHSGNPKMIRTSHFCFEGFEGKGNKFVSTILNISCSTLRYHHQTSRQDIEYLIKTQIQSSDQVNWFLSLHVT